MKSICAATAGLLLATSTGALAGTYEALCGDLECQIDVSARGISSPAGFTPSGLVSQWAVGSASDFNAGKAVAGGLGGATGGVIGGAILLGPIGALAGLVGGAVAGAGSGEEFEGYFTIIGYNKKGQKISHSFYFINDKPVKRLVSELPLITGLAQREERDIQAIETAFASGNMQLSMGGGLPAQLGSSSVQTTSKAKPVVQEIYGSIQNEGMEKPQAIAMKSPLSKEKCKNGKRKVKTDFGKVCPEELSGHQRRMQGLGRMTRPG